MFCNSQLTTFEKEQVRHVSRHMEEIVFAVVPREYEDWTFCSVSENHSEREKLCGEWAALHPLQVIVPLPSQMVPVGGSYRTTGLAKLKMVLVPLLPRPTHELYPYTCDYYPIAFQEQERCTASLKIETHLENIVVLCRYAEHRTGILRNVLKFSQHPQLRHLFLLWRVVPKPAEKKLVLEDQSSGRRA
jgi:hypothetical protein